MIFEVAQQLCFGNSLLRLSANSADANKRRGSPDVRAIHFFRRKPQQRLEQSDLRLTNRKLRRVYADCKSARSRCDVITRERSLPALVESPLRRQRQRMRRDRDSLLDRLQNICGNRWRHRLSNLEIRIFHRAPRSVSVWPEKLLPVQPNPQSSRASAPWRWGASPTAQT